MSMDGKTRLKKKKTSSQKATTCPTYNEEIVFTHLKKEKLNDVSLLFQIYHDSMTHREELGSLSINSCSKGNTYTQWKDMVDGKKSIAWWQSLQHVAAHTNSDSDSNLMGSSPPASILNRTKTTTTTTTTTTPTTNHSNLKSVTSKSLSHKKQSAEKISSTINSKLKQILSSN
jgi:hypothetical protein